MSTPPATTRSAALLAVTALGRATWGTTYLVTTELLPPGRPLLDAVVRALPAGLLIIATTRTLPGGNWWWRARVLGVLNIGVVLRTPVRGRLSATRRVPATLGAVQPLLMAALSFLLLGQRVRTRLLVSGLVGVIGVGVLVLRATAGLDAWGVVAGLLGTAAMALGVVLAKRWPRPPGMAPSTRGQSPRVHRLASHGRRAVPAAGRGRSRGHPPR
jgi:probable blue pigment (indigoidine) exporter